MQLTKSYIKNYTEFNDNFQLILPLNLENLIPEDDSVRLLSHVLEGLDYRKLYKAYSSVGRKPAVEPKIMFKIISYAYSQNIYSSRKIEKACKRDINFRWLLQGYKAPDHATINRFRKDYLSNEVVEDLFYQQVNYLATQKEILFENAFIDGTKIEANANRYTFVWKKAIFKNEAKMFQKILALFETINIEELKDFTVQNETLMDDIDKVLQWLLFEKDKRNIEFVHGIGKRKTKIQKWTEQLTEYKERQEKYNFSKNLFSKRNSYSKTDPDATFMHMKDDHMKNGQLKPAYNVQIAVESEYVTGVGIFDDRNDIATLIPMINNMQEKLGRKYVNVIADSGYESEENYLFLESNKQNPYIKPQTYEKWKKRSFKNDISKRENMKYDAESDFYICHNHRRLIPTAIIHRKSASGYKSEVTVYECETCGKCTHKVKCTKAKGNRKMQVSKTFVKKREISYKNITTEFGTKLRMNRSIQVEGAFGVLKSDYEFNRFLTRGKNSVKTEFILLCFGYNINKLHSKIQNERTQNHLHELKPID
ncbi:IS1182 family transposase [Clostridium saccharobutylicum]|uniref:Transposase DDE domain protein n=1 Tax=Clostridium saccharobutylicum TaxID=169679 RepID=A0A1S8NJT6_CLOSA|nr:IS1182 family transposase [Clostridium saccharobutylicum]OOM16710.1 transposase DDE domain protein [Clostridium saccharobutylicum]